MKRRAWLETVAAIAGALHLGRLKSFAQSTGLSVEQAETLSAIGDAVLPESIGVERRARVITEFAVWLRDWKEGVDRDHGYGVTRIVRTGPSPASRYRAQLDTLDAQARGRSGSFAGLTREDRRAVLTDALQSAKIESLPSRAGGGHVASDLMAFYFGSGEANDLCYRAAIGKDTCRGLEGSDQPPAPFDERTVS